MYFNILSNLMDYNGGIFVFKRNGDLENSFLTFSLLVTLFCLYLAISTVSIAEIRKLVEDYILCFLEIKNYIKRMTRMFIGFWKLIVIEFLIALALFLSLELIFQLRLKEMDLNEYLIKLY